MEVPDGGGAVRRYGSEEVRRLRFVRRAQAAGFTLDEIGEPIALDPLDDRSRVRTLASERITALDEKIAVLEEARSALERLRDACADGRRGPCPILKAFDPAD
jgi:MerR family mercuric resistance operon transcriptional regulator